MSNSLTPWINFQGNRPEYATPGSAGCDLKATESVTVPVGGWFAVSTGLYVEIPAGYMGMVCPRSGLAAKFGISVLNAPGIIDSDYRGEIKVLLVNHGPEDYSVKIGDRIAQLIFAPAHQGHFAMVNDLTSTARGSGGFGSTGV
jgi:dUTP pyrophosphatase